MTGYADIMILLTIIFLSRNKMKPSAKRNLSQAKASKKDEFYTQLSDIERELSHYRKHFRNKTILCNCDDPRVSNFFHYFSHLFESLKLKKLITTCYKNQERDLFTRLDCERAISLEYNGDKNDNRVPDPEEIGIKQLKGDGDFRSDECIELLKQADIVVTNPPFSLFREYVAQLIKHKKKFLVIGNFNATSYKDVFELIRKNKIWVGQSPRGMNFKRPDGTVNSVNASWFTNLDIDKRHEDLILYKKYNKEEYPKYDNFDAINVDKTKDIPVDYKGVMGVPITFLDKYNPDQFTIIGLGQGNIYRGIANSHGLSADFVESYYNSGGKGTIATDHPVLGYYNNNKEPVIPYMRILIKHKRI